MRHQGGSGRAPRARDSCQATVAIGARGRFLCPRDVLRNSRPPCTQHQLSSPAARAQAKAHDSKNLFRIPPSASPVNLTAEGIGVINGMKKLFVEDGITNLSAVASACKGMLLRTGAGKVKDLSTKQRWVRGAMQSCGVDV